jgi:diguanylate cyclase (GGDEF)-like protein
VTRKSRSIAIHVDWWPPLLVIFIMISLWTMLIQRNSDDDRAAIQDSLVSQHNVAQALALHTDQMLGRVRYLGRKLVKADKDEMTKELVRGMVAQDSAILRLLIFNEHGEFLSSSWQRPEPWEIVTARDFLARKPASALEELVVGRPPDPSQRKDWSLPIIYRPGQQAVMTGIFVMAIVDTRHFVRHFERMQLGRSGEIILVTSDGQEILHLHDGRLDFLDSIAETERFRRAFSEISGSVSERIHNAYERLYAFRQVPDSPIAVLVSRTQYDVLSDNQSTQRSYWLITFLMTVLMLAFTLFWWFAMLRKRKLMASLARSQEENARLITQLEKEKQAAYHLATHDKLTELANRMLFGEIAERYRARAVRLRGRFAILFIDLDRFKPINDTHGHRAGDMLLIEVARRLQACVRQNDLVSRFGGDEFVTLVQDVHGSQDAVRIADKVIHALSQPFSGIVAEDLFVTPSIGIALYPDDGDEVDALIRQADGAMYQAKVQGRATYVFADPALNLRNSLKNQIQAALPAAIKNGEIKLHYQPKVSLKDFSIVGLEALARWYHPQMGYISPADFVPIAEESSLIHELGEYLIDMACAQQASWRRQELPIVPVAVNISPRQLRTQRVFQHVEEALARHGIATDSIEVEITETGFIDIDEGFVAQLKRLDAQGIRFAIDDFGTGFSGLSHLRALPVSYVKIDRSFISNIRNDINDATIVSSTISLCHNLNLQSIAEGVETREQLAHLRAAGCDQAQGYLFSRPLPPEEIPPLLKQVYIYHDNSPGEKNAPSSGAFSLPD